MLKDHVLRRERRLKDKEKYMKTQSLVWTKGKEKEVCGIGSGFVVLVQKSGGL